MKNYNKTVSIYNGNNNRYTLEVPKLRIPNFGNETAKNWFIKQTGLELVEKADHYEAQPRTFKQLYKVFVVYNWETTFYNNATYKNTLFLKYSKEQ